MKKIKLPEDVKKEMTHGLEVLTRFLTDLVLLMAMLMFFAVTGVLSHIVVEHAINATHDLVFSWALHVVDGVAMTFHAAAILWVAWKAIVRFFKNLE